MCETIAADKCSAKLLAAWVETRGRASVGNDDEVSFPVGYAFVETAQGSLMGGPALAFAGAVTGGLGYAYPTDKNASGFAAPSGHATVLLGGGGGAESGGLPSIFGLDTIDKTDRTLETRNIRNGI